MSDYQLYGISIRSEIPLTFPETPAADHADVTFSAASRRWFDEQTADLPNLGRPDDWFERRRRADGADFLHFPNLFEFMVSPDGRSIAFAQLEQSTAWSFETYLLGHVLSYALVKQRLEPLHATTVVIDSAAVAFLGSSGQGKSTLAAAFVAAGHQVLTDDLLVIREVDGALCGLPGPPRLKLFPAAAERFLPKQAASTRMNPETAKLIIPLARGQVTVAPTPIHTFVALEGCEEGPSRIHLSALSGRESVLQLLRSSFNTRLVTPERLRRQLLVARDWAARIGVRRIEYPWVMADIERVRDTIVADVRSASLVRS